MIEDSIFQKIVLSNINQGVFLLDNNVIDYANHSINSLLNLEYNEIIGKKLEDIFTPESIKYIDNFEQDRDDSFYVTFLNSVLEEKRYFSIKVANYDSKKILLLSDETKLVQCQLKMEKIEDRFDKLFNTIKCGVICLEFDKVFKKFIIKDFNASASNIFSVGNEILDRDFFSVFTYFSQNLYENFLDSLQNESNEYVKDIYDSFNNKYFDATVYSISESKINFLIFDITEYKNLISEMEEKISSEVYQREGLQKESIERLRLESLYELVHWIKHHWRQPLNVISLVAQDILDSYEYGELNEESLKIEVNKIIKHTMALSRTLEEFSQFTRPDVLDEIFNIKETLESLVNNIVYGLNSKDIDIKLTILGMSDEAELDIVGDKNIFSQTILKIITNAEEAIEKRRESQGKYEGKILINILAKLDKIEISIRNNGEYLEEKDFEKIFEPYYSSKEKKNNAGLGLFLSKSLIEQSMGGRIYCKENSKGGNFIVEIPKREE